MKKATKEMMKNFLSHTDFTEDVSEEIVGALSELQSQLHLYNAGIKEIKTKLEILDEEFQTKYDYNPIHHIESRLKSMRSIISKLERRNLEFSPQSIKENLHDIAGIRVVCNYIDDVNRIADLLLRQDDIKLIKKKDYVADPKPNGYRSLHLVVEIPIYLAEKTVNVPVEIQIRTIAMDFWASLEHKLKYKTDTEISEALRIELKECAQIICIVDEKMQAIHKKLQ